MARAKRVELYTCNEYNIINGTFSGDLPDDQKKNLTAKLQLTKDTLKDDELAHERSAAMESLWSKKGTSVLYVFLPDCPCFTML